MPLIKSAKKALKQSKTKKERNLKKKKEMKATAKKIKKLISEKKHKEAEEILPKYYKVVDKAAKTGFIKKNNASRKKSRITKMVVKKEA